MQQNCYEFHLAGGPLDGVYTVEPVGDGLMIGPGSNLTELGKMMNTSEIREHLGGKLPHGQTAHFLYEKYRNSKENDQIDINCHCYRVVERTTGTENQNVRCHSWAIIRCEHVPVQ